MKPPEGSHQLRRGRESIKNQAYFVTTATDGRAPLFLDPRAAGAVLDALKWLDKAGRLVLCAAVLMPDHLHVVFELKTGALPQVMHSLKSYTAKQVNTLLGRRSALWQGQYHDHAVRKSENLNDVILYMLHNPVRAGIVGDFHDYPYWWCRWEI
jgi:putative transposase